MKTHKFKIFLGLVISLSASLLYAQANIASLQQQVDNKLRQSSAPETVTQVIAEGNNPVLAAEVVAKTVPDAAPEIAGAAAKKVPPAAPDIAGTVAQVVPKAAPEIAGAVAKEVPKAAARIASTVAQVVPEAAAKIAGTVAKARVLRPELPAQ